MYNSIKNAILEKIDFLTEIPVVRLKYLGKQARAMMLSPHGLISRPRADAHGVLLGGDGQPGFWIPSSAGALIKTLNEDDTLVFGANGDAYILIKADGNIEMVPKTGGTVTVDGDLSVTGSLIVTVDATIGGKSFLLHTHTSASSGSPTGPPL